MTVRLAAPGPPRREGDDLPRASEGRAPRAPGRRDRGGNHNAEAPGARCPCARWHPLEVLHFSFRSAAQLERKARRRLAPQPRTYEPTLHQILLDEAHRDGRVAAFYDSFAVDDEALAAGLADGTLAVDTRLRDALRALRGDDGAFVLPAAGRRLAFPRPSARDDAAYAAEASVLVEIDGIVRAEQRVRALEERLARGRARRGSGQFVDWRGDDAGHDAARAGRDRRRRLVARVPPERRRRRRDRDRQPLAGRHDRGARGVRALRSGAPDPRAGRGPAPGRVGDADGAARGDRVRGGLGDQLRRGRVLVAARGLARRGARGGAAALRDGRGVPPRLLPETGRRSSSPSG